MPPNPSPNTWPDGTKGPKTIGVCEECGCIGIGHLSGCKNLDPDTKTAVPVIPLSVAEALARDLQAVRKQIENVETAAEDQGGGRFQVWADDMQQLGWARVLCDNALAHFNTIKGESDAS